jgi:hypothetical protein
MAKLRLNNRKWGVHRNRKPRQTAPKQNKDNLNLASSGKVSHPSLLFFQGKRFKAKTLNLIYHFNNQKVMNKI